MDNVDMMMMCVAATAMHVSMFVEKGAHGGSGHGYHEPHSKMA
jgi:hypothetical protein